MNDLLSIGLCIAGAGAIGGLLNAMVTQNGFIFPRAERLKDGGSVLRPGIIGTLVIGALAAVVSWGLYGPLSSTDIFASTGIERTKDTNGQEDQGAKEPSRYELTLATLAGGVLVGFGGGRWLTNEADKRILSKATTTAGSLDVDPTKVPPIELLHQVQKA